MKTHLLWLALILAAPASAEHWIATWGTSLTLYRAAGRGGPPPAPPKQPAAAAPAPAAAGRGPARRFGIPPAIPTVNNQTVRMIVRTSVGGRSVRIRLANAFGAATLRLGSAHIAIRDRDSAIVSGSDRPLTFSANPSAILYAGQVAISDPVSLTVAPLSDLAVSLYLPGDTGPPTSHTFGLRPTYISQAGDFTGAASIADATTTESYYWLAGVDVLAPDDAGTLVTFGDSITDGDQSTPNGNAMWPAVLAARLQAKRATRNIGVVNAGISGNRVLGDGQSALARVYRDVLAQPGIRWMTFLEGINDISGGTRATSNPQLTAADLIAAYKQLIELAHLHGVKVIGCTITPWGGSSGFNETGEAVREAVNQWIRTGRAFDAVVDFDAATRDPKDPKRFRAEADSPDLLHPGDGGYKLMAEAVDLAIFTARGARR
jgi:lysophospholipase L1-like esterase